MIQLCFEWWTCIYPVLPAALKIDVISRVKDCQRQTKDKPKILWAQPHRSIQSFRVGGQSAHRLHSRRVHDKAISERIKPTSLANSLESTVLGYTN